MKKRYIVLVLLSTLLLLSASEDAPSFNTAAVEALYVSDVKKLNVAADSLWASVSRPILNQKMVVDAFRQCRDCYKQSEGLTEYFYPNTAKLINGPAIQEAEMESGVPKIVQPEGLQVIAELVFLDSIVEAEKRRLVQTVWRFVSACRWLEKLSAKQRMLDWQIMDAMKLEVVRVFTLGVTGFDTPVSGNTTYEAAVAFEGVDNCLQLIVPTIRDHNEKIADNLLQSLKKGRKYLAEHKDFDSFNRMTFIRDYANPIYTNIVRSCEVLELQWPRIPTAIRRNAKTIFEKDAMDPWFYARDNRTELQRKEVAELGQLLFFDPILSGDQQRACASCHRPELAFADGLPTSVAFSTGKALKRNSPTILNAAFQASYFFDGRVNFLEDQIRQVVNNNEELHGDFSLSIGLLKTSAEYRRLFAYAFRGSRDTAISTNAIVSAISAYERTLVSNDSKFDKHIRGEGNFMTKAEVLGFNIFMGKAQCGTCHFLPMFNGTFPPFYTKSESEIIGVPLVSDTSKPAVDPDLGRLLFSGLELHRFAFKTSGLRNVGITAPYMHNGVFKTLREVVDFYNRGGAAGVGEDLPTQTLSATPLDLKANEIDALVKFMECITDTTGLTHRPTRLPEFKNDELNKRKIGGTY